MENTEKLSNESKTEWSIAALIALLSILTASTAYYSHIEDSNSNHNYFTSQAIIVEANSLDLEANQAIIYDLNAYDSYYLADLEGNETKADYYFSGLSDSAIADFNRSSGPFLNNIMMKCIHLHLTERTKELNLLKKLKPKILHLMNFN